MRYVAYLVLPAAGFLACSLTVPADREQCTTDSDCRSFASNAVCVSRICQAAQIIDAGADGDGGEADPAWGCVGKVPTLPENDSQPVSLQFTLLNFTGDPLVGVLLKLCRSQDTPCATPLKDDLVTDDTGSVTLPVYTGFRGYLESKPSPAHSTLFPFIAYVPIVNPAIPATTARTHLTAFDTGTIAAISGQLEAVVNDTLGQLIFTARDCKNDLGTDIVFFTASATSESVTWYLDSNKTPSVAQTETSVPGVGGIFNVKPGVPVLKYERDGKRVGEQGIVVRAGTLTYANAIPTP